MNEDLTHSPVREGEDVSYQGSDVNNCFVPLVTTSYMFHNSAAISEITFRTERYSKSNSHVFPALVLLLLWKHCFRVTYPVNARLVILEILVKWWGEKARLCLHCNILSKLYSRNDSVSRLLNRLLFCLIYYLQKYFSIFF